MLLVFAMDSMPIVAVMINFFLTFMNVIYLLRVRPFKQGNKSLIFNESCLLLAFYHLILLTNYVDDIQVRNNVGWSLIATVMLMIFVNLLVIVIKLVVIVFTSFKKYFNRNSNKVSKYFQDIIPI